MPVIVVEGPDESGKTTLAKSIQVACKRVTGFESIEVGTSPTKQGWTPQLGKFLGDLTDSYDGFLYIQDRTPEISESVYGTMRGNPRGRGWAYEMYRWLNQPIFFIFCRNDEQYLTGIHHDVADNPLRDADLEKMRLLYDQTYFNIRMAMLFGNPHDFRIIEYNRFQPDSWKEVFWTLREWLVTQFPEKSKDFQHAIHYAMGQPFPVEVD